MKIVVLDGYVENPGDLSWEPLDALGDLIVYDRTEPAQIVQRIGDADIVVTNKTPISAETLKHCPNVKMIGVLATGFNVIDCDAAQKRNIPVCNVPSYGTYAVAQFAIAMLLEICHHIAHHSQTVHDGKWTSHADWCYWDTPLIALEGKTMGIIGFGRIGQQTARIAKAMGMNILAYNRSQNPIGQEIGSYVTLDELLSQSDVISLHCPLTPETEGIINHETIAKMKDGVILLNNSRGQLVAEQALAEALTSGKIAAVGLDVVSTEPIRADNPLLRAPNCLITPHISWAAKECRQRILDTTAQNIRAFLTGSPMNVVNG